MQLRAVYELIKESARDFSEDKVPRLGAALAYYSIFSLAPLLIIAIGIASMIFGEQAARGEILGQIEGTIGTSAATAVQDMLRAARQDGGGIAATIVGAIVLLFGASGVFVQLQDALNTIWHVAPKPNRSWWATIRERFLSCAMVFGIGFLLLVSLIVSSALSAVSKFLTPAAIPGSSYLWQGVNALVSLGLITVLLASMYKVLPDVQLGWHQVWIGALATALLFTAGKYLIGVYLAHSSTASAFGAAGSLIVILVWVYYSSQIVLFGAEMTRTLVKRSGQQTVPAENAVVVGEDELCRQGMASRASLDAAMRQGAATNRARPEEARSVS